MKRRQACRHLACAGPFSTAQRRRRLEHAV